MRNDKDRGREGGEDSGGRGEREREGDSEMRGKRERRERRVR